jgi:hypothetical protein
MSTLYADVASKQALTALKKQRKKIRTVVVRSSPGWHVANYSIADQNYSIADCHTGIDSHAACQHWKFQLLNVSI